MSTSHTPKEYRKALNYSYIYIFFSSIMIGLSQRFIEAFAAFLSASNLQFTLLASLPQFLGGISQLSSLRLLSVLKSRKAMNLVFLSIQTIMWIPIIWLGFSEIPGRGWFLILMMVVYISATLLINPVWTSWIMDIVRFEHRGSFYARRSKIVGTISLLAILGGGIVLRTYTEMGLEAKGFAIIFGAGIFFNIISMIVVSLPPEPAYTIIKPKIDLSRFVRTITKGHQGRSILYLSLMSFAVYLSVPFYIPYLIKDLSFSYLQLSVLLLCPALARIFFSERFGSLIDRFGPTKMLSITSYMIALNPALWLLGDSFYYFVFVQLFTGFSYGAYEIAYLTFLTNTTTPKDRISLISYYNFFSSIFILAGALASNLALKLDLFRAAYLNAFFLSFILRFLVVALFPRFKEKDLYYSTTYSKLTSEITSMLPMSQTLRKLAAAKDLVSIRLVNEDVVRMKKSKSFEMIRVKPQAQKKRDDSHLLYNIYMCNACSGEFVRNKYTSTRLMCPYCGRKTIALLRRSRTKRR